MSDNIISFEGYREKKLGRKNWDSPLMSFSERI